MALGTAYSGTYTYGTKEQQKKQAKQEILTSGQASATAPKEIVAEAKAEIAAEKPKTTVQELSETKSKNTAADVIKAAEKGHIEGKKVGIGESLPEEKFL